MRVLLLATLSAVLIAQQVIAEEIVRLRSGEAEVAATEEEERKKITDSCWKGIEGRGVGHLPNHGECPPTQEKGPAGLCYPTCSRGFKGLGPLCLEVCEGKYPADGLVFCCESEEICKAHLTDLGSALPKALSKAIEDAQKGATFEEIVEDLRDLIEDTLDIVFPICTKVRSEEPSQAEVIVEQVEEKAKVEETKAEEA